MLPAGAVAAACRGRPFAPPCEGSAARPESATWPRWRALAVASHVAAFFTNPPILAYLMIALQKRTIAAGYTFVRGVVRADLVTLEEMTLFMPIVWRQLFVPIALMALVVPTCKAQLAGRQFVPIVWRWMFAPIALMALAVQMNVMEQFLPIALMQIFALIALMALVAPIFWARLQAMKPFMPVIWVKPLAPTVCWVLSCLLPVALFSLSLRAGRAPMRRWPLGTSCRVRCRPRPTPRRHGGRGRRQHRPPTSPSSSSLLPPLRAPPPPPPRDACRRAQPAPKRTAAALDVEESQTAAEETLDETAAPMQRIHGADESAESGPDSHGRQEAVGSAESDSCSTVDSEDFGHPRGAGDAAARREGAAVSRSGDRPWLRIADHQVMLIVPTPTLPLRRVLTPMLVHDSVIYDPIRFLLKPSPRAPE
ncbi:unnamed protein product, partial [Prorocentrum cordatum]